MADAVLCSPSVNRLVNSLATVALDMKDVSTASTRHARQSLVYPKKRPSPHGISKSHKSPLLPANGASRLSPRAAKAALAQQRQKTAQLLAIRRESVYLEEEYRDEIRRYMHDMEVSSSSSFSFPPVCSRCPP
jgi:G2/mitotic-specific cyclin-B, other